MSDDDIKKAFDLFDTDNSGAISTDELRFALTAMGLDITSDDVAEFLQNVDTSGDGTVDLEEFSAMCKRNETKLGQPDDIRMAFQRLGGNDDPECKLPGTRRVDFLDVHGLRKATAGMFGVPVEDKILREIITWSHYAKEYDRNGIDIFYAWSEKERAARTSALDINTFMHAVCKYDPNAAELRRAKQLRLRAQIRAIDEAERQQEAELARKASPSRRGSTKQSGSQRSSSGNRRDSQKSASGSNTGSSVNRRVPSGSLGNHGVGTSPQKRESEPAEVGGSRRSNQGGSRKGSMSGTGSAGGSHSRRSAPNSSGHLRQSSGKAGSDMGGSQSRRSVPGDGSRRGSSRHLQER